jgi:riboflavin kinase / FMN adenylyltransferase
MIWRSLEEVPADFGPCALTVGNFDGVHVGHQHILQRVTQKARESGWKAAVLTFEPHPAKLVAPARAPKLLTTLDQRCELMSRQGIEQILILPFNRDIAKLTPEEFVKQILVDKLQTRAVLVGDNFRFGNRAAGNTKTLRELGAKYGYVIEVVSAVSIRGQITSSTGIRSRVEAGSVSKACRMLGRCHALEGRVVHGHGIGSKRTVPTLNLETEAEVLPATGVYITRTHDLNGGRQWPSITNIGYRPTFGGDRLSIETFLLSPLEGTSPDKIRVEFLRRVRDERKFESAEALKAQILRDVGRAQAYFRRLGSLTSSQIS